MNVLIACEESQEVCKAFRAKGHEAFSCDIEECSGGHPEWHVQDDALRLINGYKNGYGCPFFVTNDGKTHDTPERWDLLIAHPPCTYLAVSGNAWFNVKKYGDKAIAREREREAAADFFMRFITANCDRIAVENPIGVMSSFYRKPDQIIQPYQFGHPAKKATCLWLKGLPLLQPTTVADPGDFYVSPRGKKFSVGSYSDAARDENGKIISWNDPRTKKLRSKTFPGIAKAMAEQWG